MPSSVARLHRALVDVMRRHRPNAPDGPVTVAEIYQDLVPYRSVRSALGFALNADYEHALLELLAGVEGRARVEPAEAREALRLELESTNPNTGVFRGYAACDVWITALEEPDEPADADAPELQVETGWSTPADVLQVVSVDAAGAPASAAQVAVPLQAASLSGFAASAQSSTAAPRTSESTAVADAATVDATQSKQCHHCNRPLPHDRSVRFCPFCGKDQQLKCPSCGEELEPKWHFCVSCGNAVG